MLRVMMGLAMAMVLAVPAMAADWTTLTDRTYRFTVEVPIAYSKEPRAVDPPATSMAWYGRTHEDGTFSFSLIAMNFGPGVLDAYSDEMIVGTLMDGAKENRTLIGAREKITLSGRPAWRQRLKIPVDGVDTEATVIGVRRGDVVYLLIVGGDKARQADAARMAASFALIDDQI